MIVHKCLYVCVCMWVRVIMRRALICAYFASPTHPRPPLANSLARTRPQFTVRSDGLESCANGTRQECGRWNISVQEVLC